MHSKRLVVNLTLGLAFLVIPAFATKPAAAPEASAQEVALAPAPPAGLEGLFLPAPVEKYGMTQGPCTVSVPCPGGLTIRCSGQRVCYWKYHGPGTMVGFVECDGVRTTCPLLGSE